MNHTTACPDWETRIVERESLITSPPIFPDVAEDALKLFKNLRIFDMYDKPKIGEVTRDWVFDFVAAIFGSYDPVARQRLINTGMLLISKKNTKSTMAAGIMLTAMMKCQIPNTELLILAPTKKIAENAFNPIKGMIENDPVLQKLLIVKDYNRSIEHRTMGHTLRVVAAEGETVAGAKAAYVLIDELWVFGKKRNAANMLAEATGGLASRPDGFVLYLTTQSDEPPAGVFKDKLKYARAVRDGKIHDPSFLPVLYEFPQNLLEEKAYENPAYFYITNPNLGASTSVSFIEKKINEARAESEESLQIVYSKYLNLEIGLNLRHDKWSGAEFWEQAGSLTSCDLDYIIEHSEVITIGIDGGGLDDLLAVGVIGRNAENPSQWLCWTHAWVNPLVLQKRPEIAPRLQDFEQDGDLTITYYNEQDLDELAEICARVYESGLLYRIGLDPAGVKTIIDKLYSAGIPEDSLRSVSQGYRLGGAIETFGRQLRDGNIAHNGSNMNAWCVSNARVVALGNGINITKQVSGRSKIDPLMALFDAAELMGQNPTAQGSIDSWLQDIVRL